MRNEVWRKNENSKRFNTILWVKAEKIGSSKMDFIETKKAIEEMMKKDYKIFITALISIEKDIINQEALDMMYQKYMNTDEMQLLNDEFDEIIEYILWKNYDLIPNFYVIMTIYHNFKNLM